jgi:hypothetical protein
MFISDKIVFIHLQKTGGVHISQLFSLLICGEKITGHPPLEEAQRSKFIIGSIRNPWDWYVSLWAYGCKNKGSTKHNLTRQLNSSKIDTMLGKGINGYHPPAWQRWKIRRAEKNKNVQQWLECYQDSNDPEQFRQWLRLLLNSRHKRDIQEGFALSPVSKDGGLLTYRHLVLQSTLGKKLYTDSSLQNYSKLKNAFHSNSLLNHTIRTEHITEDMLSIIDKIGVADITTAKELVMAKGKKRHNTSNRNSAAFY